MPELLIGSLYGRDGNAPGGLFNARLVRLLIQILGFGNPHFGQPRSWLQHSKLWLATPTPTRRQYLWLQCVEERVSWKHW